MDPASLVTVLSTFDPIKAEIVKNALEAEGIRCFLEGINQAETAFVGIPVEAVEVQVAAADAERAAELIRAHEAARLATPQKEEEDKEDLPE